MVTLFFLMGQASSFPLPGEWLASARYFQLVITVGYFVDYLQLAISALSVSTV